MQSHITRYRMHRMILGLWPVKPAGVDVLGINGLGAYREIFADDCRIVETSFPAVDVMNLPFQRDSFDFVTCEQTIEHVVDPFQAVKEMHRVLRPGGVLILTTVAAYPFHGEANNGDYFRFTHQGLRLLAKDFPVLVQLDTWGGPDAADRVFGDPARRTERVDSRNMAAAMASDRKYQMVVWGVFRK